MASKRLKGQLAKYFYFFLFTAFILFSTFYLSHTLYRPTSQQSSSAKESRDSSKGSSEHNASTGIDLEDEEEEEELEDDITFLFGIIDMNRKTHMGIENYTFEKDYLQQVKNLLADFRPSKVQVIMQQKYFENLKPHLYDGVDVRFIEVEDLRNWKYYKDIERIRTSDWWIPATPWLANVPQGYSDLYNPIVMHKLLWLRDLSVQNPFKTRYFMWLDSGGICTPRINPRSGMQLSELKPKAKYYMDKFLISVTPYAMSHELHGCHREPMMKVTKGLAPCMITKGWMMGGQKKHLVEVAKVYEGVLAESLELGCLGTEETLLTMVSYIRPDLFHLHYNVNQKSNPFDSGGDVCHFIWPHQDYLEKELPTAKWVREQKEKERTGSEPSTETEASVDSNENNSNDQQQ